MGWETWKNAPKNVGMAAWKATLQCCDEESTSCGWVSGKKSKNKLGGRGRIRAWPEKAA
jgi:hypothetical protein